MCRPRTSWHFLGVLAFSLAVYAVWAVALWNWLFARA